jgi:hypothetical protein
LHERIGRKLDGAAARTFHRVDCRRDIGEQSTTTTTTTTTTTSVKSIKSIIAVVAAAGRGRRGGGNLSRRGRPRQALSRHYTVSFATNFCRFPPPDPAVTGGLGPHRTALDPSSPHARSLDLWTGFHGRL